MFDAQGAAARSVVRDVGTWVLEGAHVQTTTSPSARPDVRARYYQLLNSDEHPGIGAVATELVHRAFDQPPRPAATLAAALADAGRWRDGLEAAAHELPAALGLELALQHAPAALIHGCWLEHASGAATSHRAVAAQLLRIHAAHLGAGNPAAHRGNRYAQFLRGLGVALPEPAAWGFAEHEALHDFAFEPPVLQLALARAPRALLPELLGFHLFSAAYAVPPVIAAIAARATHGAFLVEAATADARAAATADARAAIDAYLADPAPEAQPIDRPTADGPARIVAGFAVARALAERWERAAAERIARAASRPHARMVALVARKAPYARGYHARTVLDGRPLDDWFAAEPFDAEAFVHALGRSRLVKPGHPQRSALLVKATAFGAPMFRVFSPDELETIAAWITSLPGAPTAIPVAAPIDPPPPPPAPPPPRDHFPVRELYHRLVNVERYPDVLPAARRFAQRWLAGAAIGLRRGPRALPFEPYSHPALATWLDAQHRRQVDSYVPLTGEPALTRAQVIDSAVQLCPMVFIDGAWVQAFTRTDLAASELGALLFHIYYDEVGNGDPEINHPNVYRRLMRAMAVDLPAFGSRAFATWPGFQDASFEVPVFWLAISQFPRALLPEILGVNLAMELSGVGGSYRQGRDLLRHYGYDTTFIELHNTIDNVSTGHTAFARRAIQLHLDAVLGRGGRDEVQRHWLRVWTGYRALVPPAGRLTPILRELKVALATAFARAG
jgi:hypothetical protein